jgi:hypothetical protein
MRGSSLPGLVAPAEFVAEKAEREALRKHLMGECGG